jgi:hypothetical protein
LGDGLEAVRLLAFQQLQLPAEAVDGPEVGGDINENEGQEREHHYYG